MYHKMNRVTEKELQELTDMLNENIIKGNHPHETTMYSINNAPCYGGWSLNNNNDSKTIVRRLPPREFKRVLQGMLIAFGTYYNI